MARGEQARRLNVFWQVCTMQPFQFSLRRLFLYTFIVAISLSAVVGIGQLLTGYDRDFRVLLTAFNVAMSSVLSLACGAALEARRGRIIPIAGIVLTLASGGMILFMTWATPRGDAEWYFKTMGTCSIFAIALSHISLLSIAQLAPRYNWALPLAKISILGVASIVTFAIYFGERLFHTANLWRWIAVAAIIDAATSVLIPIFHLLSRSELRAHAAPAAANTQAIDDEITRLESRLAELRRLRAETVTR
jgi:hypothetical protein